MQREKLVEAEEQEMRKENIKSGFKLRYKNKNCFDEEIER